ncbi:uncharacterized protein [Argopecten irradians]|uniref:uncharacterized protein n=1 Tax=Argopecten irradians TaxID=31199 RepID=UPI003712732A
MEVYNSESDLLATSFCDVQVLDSLLASPTTADTMEATAAAAITDASVPSIQPGNCSEAVEADLSHVSPDPSPIPRPSYSQNKRAKELQVMPQLHRRAIKTSDLQRMQFEVLQEQKRKLILQC